MNAGVSLFAHGCGALVERGAAHQPSRHHWPRPEGGAEGAGRRVAGCWPEGGADNRQPAAGLDQSRCRSLPALAQAAGPLPGRSLMRRWHGRCAPLSGACAPQLQAYSADANSGTFIKARLRAARACTEGPRPRHLNACTASAAVRGRMARVHAYAPRPAVYRYESACAPSSSRLSGVDVPSIDQHAAGHGCSARLLLNNT